MVFILFFFFFFTNITFAQNNPGKIVSDCPYTFSRDLKEGDTGKDVYVLQEILNSDKRTTIAVSGVGSPGKESTMFGKGTREALKRFQALFIEFIGVSDGKFNKNTITIAQAICNGEDPNKAIQKSNQTISTPHNL